MPGLLEPGGGGKSGEASPWMPWSHSCFGARFAEARFYRGAARAAIAPDGSSGNQQGQGRSWTGWDPVRLSLRGDGIYGE